MVPEWVIIVVHPPEREPAIVVRTARGHPPVRALPKEDDTVHLPGELDGILHVGDRHDRRAHLLSQDPQSRHKRMSRLSSPSREQALEVHDHADSEETFVARFTNRFHDA